MKTVYNSNYSHKKKSSFAEKTKQAFGALCSWDDGKSYCRDYWCPIQQTIRFYMRLRFRIASQLPNYELNGEVEADENYFGGIRKGKRGKGAAGKVPAFGLLKRGGKMLTTIAPNARTKPCSRSLKRESLRTALLTPTLSRRTMHSTSQNFITCTVHQSFQALRRQGNSHQRDRKLLEPSQTTSEKIQWHQAEQFSLVSQGVLMALQWRQPSKPLQTA